MHKLRISDSLSLPLEAVTQTFAILAKRGVGKTYTAAVMVEEMLEAGQQVVVVDPIGVWFGLRSSADGSSAGYDIVVFGGEHSDVPLEENSGEVIATAIIENGFSAILDLSLLRKGAQVRFMTAFAETLYRLNRKPIHLSVDEADAFCPQRPMRDEARLLGAFEDIVRRGRARGIGVTLITQRAAVINKNVLTQCEVLICLRTIAPQDREAIDAWIEVHGTEKQRAEMMEHLASLPIGTAYFWSPGWLDIFKKVEVRKRLTFDSSSTPKVGEKIVAPKQIAAVDLKRLGKQINDSIERAKANDPAQLKAKIRQLEKEAAKPVTLKPTIILNKPVTKMIAPLTEADHRRIEKAMVQGLAIMEKLEKAISRIKALGTTATQNRPIVTSRAPIATPHRATAQPPTPKATIQQPDGEVKIGKGAREVLKAIAQGQDGATDTQIAVLTGYKATSRAVFRQQLTAKGYIEPGGRQYIATPSGIDWLGSDFEPLPTGTALREYWLKTLTGGELKLFEVYIHHYPTEVGNNYFVEAGFYKETSVAVFKQKLVARDLIIPGRGSAKANPILFE